jgi:hypothetical protein
LLFQQKEVDMTASRLMERRKASSPLWRVWVAVLGILLVGLPITPARAQLTVEPGWDLFTTAPGTTFGGVPFTGVPLGNFDFGPPIGVQATGNTDTIVERQAQASVPGPVVPPSQTAAPIPIEMVALQLVSTVPTDFGLGIGFYFITLQSARGGPASVGQMTITFDNMNVPGPPQPQNGTFDSFIDVFFDVRLGALNGPIALSSNLPLTSDDTPWSHFPAPGELLINGVNDFLNGNNRLGDFHPIGVVEESHPSGAQHHATVTILAAAPEPGSFGFLLLGIGVAGAGVVRRLKS